MDNAELSMWSTEILFICCLLLLFSAEGERAGGEDWGRKGEPRGVL